MIDLLESGKMYPPLDLCVDARAVYDAIAASDACELAECSLTFHLISVRDRMTHGLIPKLYWVDTRDVLADVLTKGGIDRLLLHSVSNICVYGARPLVIPHTAAGIVSRPPGRQEVGFEHRNVEDLGGP